MADPNRKTKQHRSGDMIDARIRAAQQERTRTYSQFSGVSAGGTGAGGGSGDATTDSTYWLRQVGTATASGGTLALDFEDSSAFTSVHGFYDVARTSYHESAHFSLLEHSSSVTFAASNRVRLPASTDREFDIAESLSSGNIRLTFTNNHATEDITVTVLYALVPA